MRPPYKEALDELTLTIGETVGDLVQPYIMGYLLYRDDNGLKRKTGFCALYLPDTKRFQRISDPDYEYAD